MRKKHNFPLQEAIKDVLGIKSIKEISGKELVGIAILLIALHQEKYGIESPYINDYLDSNEIPYTDEEIENALKVIAENNLIKDGKLNPVGSEDIYSSVTWCLWACLFNGYVERKIKNGEVYYRLTPKGEEYVLKLINETPSNPNRKI
jgi:hypothetical protein